MSGRRWVPGALLIALGSFGNSCQKPAADAPGVPPLSAITQLGALQASALTEASGVVRSTRRADVFWSQNDSGNDAELFAYDSTGTALGTARVTGASNRDWEAIAIGPCPEGSCVYIGDVGDNRERQGAVSVWRVAEPMPVDTATAPATVLRFRYSQGPHDVEAMWVSPDTTIWLLTKRPRLAPSGVSRPAQLYALPASAWRAAGEQVARLVDSLPIVPLASDKLTWITDASLSPADSSGARRLAIRTYGRVYLFDADGVTGRPGKLEGSCSLAPLHELYGEGVVWLADGRLLFNAEGRGSLLQAGRCP